MYSDAPFYYLFSISWYQEFDFLISRNHFLISRNIILDIKKWNLFLDIKKSEFLISRNIHNFLLSRIVFLDIKNFISWYQEIDFLISKNISWYQKIFLDIKNSFLDIKKCLINSKTAPHNWEVHIDIWIGNFKCPHYKPRKTCVLLIYSIALP